MVSQSKWETYKYDEAIATSATCGAGTAYPSGAPEIDHTYVLSVSTPPADEDSQLIIYKMGR
jgi:hypothetical protein